MNTYQKILTLSVVVLIGLNIILVGVIWKNNPTRNHEKFEMRKRDRLNGFLKEILGLDQNQIEDFRLAQKQHQVKMNELDREMRKLNGAMHEIIVNEKTNQELTISDKIDSVHLLIKTENIDFVKVLSDLCRDDQKSRLLKMLHELPDRRGFRGERGRNDR